MTTYILIVTYRALSTEISIHSFVMKLCQLKENRPERLSIEKKGWRGEYCIPTKDTGAKEKSYEMSKTLDKDKGKNNARGKVQFNFPRFNVRGNKSPYTYVSEFSSTTVLLILINTRRLDCEHALG